MKRTLLILLTLTACTHLMAYDPTPEARADSGKYFLKDGQQPNSLLILPPPPQPGTTAFSHDQAMYHWGITQRNTPRGEQAKNDANLDFDNFAAGFSDPMGITINAKQTPYLYNLICRIGQDAGDLATAHAKNYYMRMRPYMIFMQPTLIPNDEPILATNGSYPSGHSCMGMSVALVLMEINPERQNELFIRGYEFGQSRVIAGFHFQSYVDAGRLCAAAIVARLHADEGFLQALELAKQEFAHLRNR